MPEDSLERHLECFQTEFTVKPEKNYISTAIVDGLKVNKVTDILGFHIIEGQ